MPKLSYRDYLQYRKDFWKQKQDEEQRRIEKYGE